MEETTRPRFDAFLTELINGEDVLTKYKLEAEGFVPKKFPAKLGEYKSLFDNFYDKEKLMWVNWLKTIPTYVVPKEGSYTDVIVPTADSVRVTKLMNFLLQGGKHPLFCGPTGTGKSIGVASELKNAFDDSHYAHYSLAFSA